MSTVVVTGTLGRVAALTLSIHDCVSPTCEVTFHSNGDYHLDLVDAYREPRDQPTTYGPPKKGKGGKVRRW